jgi:hypothetical protein
LLLLRSSFLVIISVGTPICWASSLSSCQISPLPYEGGGGLLLIVPVLLLLQW